MKRMKIEVEDWTTHQVFSRDMQNYAVYINNRYYEDLSFQKLLELINTKIKNNFKPKKQGRK